MRDNPRRGEPRPPDRARRLVPRARGGRRAHARRLGAAVRRRGARRTRTSSRTSSAGSRWCRATARSSRSRRWCRAGRCGSTTRTSTPATTCATRRCPQPAGEPSCAGSPGACSPSGSTAPSRCGSCGWSTASGDDRFAIIGKTHHCLVDGISGVDIATVLFDLDPDPPEPPPAEPWFPRPEPTRATLLADALAERAARPLGLARAAAGAVTAPAGRRSRRACPRSAGSPRSRRPGSAARRVAAERADRAAPPVRLGRRRPRGVQGDQERARRDRQRRRARGRRRRAAHATSSPTATTSTPS